MIASYEVNPVQGADTRQNKQERRKMIDILISYAIFTVIVVNACIYGYGMICLWRRITEYFNNNKK